jgi:hypothetical protein
MVCEKNPLNNKGPFTLSSNPLETVAPKTANYTPTSFTVGDCGIYMCSSKSFTLHTYTNNSCYPRTKTLHHTHKGFMYNIIIFNRSHFAITYATISRIRCPKFFHSCRNRFLFSPASESRSILITFRSCKERNQ